MTSPNAVVIGMLHLLMLAMSPLVPVPDIAAPESINHGCACDDAVATKTGGARNIPRGFVGVCEIDPGSIDKSKLRPSPSGIRLIIRSLSTNIYVSVA